MNLWEDMSSACNVLMRVLQSYDGILSISEIRVVPDEMIELLDGIITEVGEFLDYWASPDQKKE